MAGHKAVQFKTSGTSERRKRRERGILLDLQEYYYTPPPWYSGALRRGSSTSLWTNARRPILYDKSLGSVTLVECIQVEKLVFEMILDLCCIIQGKPKASLDHIWK